MHHTKISFYDKCWNCQDNDCYRRLWACFQGCVQTITGSTESRGQGSYQCQCFPKFCFNNNDMFDKDSLSKDFCREALAWRSLSHHFILPLLGIFEVESQLFLVSPFMANGTLTEWRKRLNLIKISEIHRLVRFLCFNPQSIRRYRLDVRGSRGRDVSSLRRNCSWWLAWSKFPIAYLSN